MLIYCAAKQSLLWIRLRFPQMWVLYELRWEPTCLASSLCRGSWERLTQRWNIFPATPGALAPVRSRSWPTARASRLQMEDNLGRNGCSPDDWRWKQQEIHSGAWRLSGEQSGKSSCWDHVNDKVNVVAPFFSAPVCAGLPAAPAHAAFPLCVPSQWLWCQSGRTWWSSFLPKTPNFNSEVRPQNSQCLQLSSGLWRSA